MAIWHRTVAPLGEWRHQAACRGTDPELFYPGPCDIAGVNQAKAICQRCPVREPCLDHALTNREPGVWGATSEREREKIRKAKRGTAA